MDTAASSPAAVWNSVFERVRKTVSSPMVWLAMQAAKPVTIEGNFFVAGLATDQQYLANNLQTFEAVTAIEDALREISGHILAFRLIEGVTQADWEAVRWRQLSADSHPEALEAAPRAAPSSAHRAAPQEAAREKLPSWEKLNERLTQMYKTAPGIRYTHGQARFVLDAVKYISDTMDTLMPGPDQPPDEAQERALSRVLERLSGAVNLDPMFLALELFRYRQSRGK